MNPICRIALQHRAPARVRVQGVDSNRCRYHRRRTVGELAALTRLPPCPLAAMALYSTQFALHCGPREPALDRSGREVRCPLGEAGVTFRCSTAPMDWTAARWLRHAVGRVLAPIRPTEAFDKRVVTEVVEVGQPCPAGIVPGDRYLFNIDDDSEICPAAFHSIYPWSAALQQGHVAVCPDHKIRVRFADAEVQAVRADASPCETYGARLRVERGRAALPIETARWYAIDDLVQQTGICCFSAFHVAFPYLHALVGGGRLGFHTRDRYAARASCPASEAAVWFLVGRDRAGAHGYTCTRAHADCPRAIEDGETVRLGRFTEHLAWWTGLHDLYTIVRQLEDQDRREARLEVVTGHGDREIVWMVEATP